MTPETMEKLQILKFGFKQEALSFTDDWILSADMALDEAGSEE